MSTRKVWWSGAWVDVTTGGAGGGLWTPGPGTTDGLNLTNSTRPAISLSGSATPFNPGNWVEWDASLSVDIDALDIDVTVATGATTQNTSTLIQVGTGGSGSETVVATFGVGFMSGSPPLTPVIPGRIAAGSRVAFRVLSSAKANMAVNLAVTGRASVADCGAPLSIGADSATGYGIQIATPGSLNTFGAWTQLAASTASRLIGLAAYPQMAGSANTAQVSITYQIGVGAAASETPIATAHLRAGTAESWITGSGIAPDSRHYWAVDIPQGSRIAARFQHGATGTPLDLCLVGATAP